MAPNAMRVGLGYLGSRWLRQNPRSKQKKSRCITRSFLQSVGARSPHIRGARETHQQTSYVLKGSMVSAPARPHLLHWPPA
jgi:hypothetical protein